mgnify:FL=1
MKVKLNKKGFAISTMIYSIFLMFLILVASLLALLSYRKTIFDAHKKAIYEEANNLPSVIVKNVSISYDERLNYSLTDDISLCMGCSIISVTLDDYEIEREDYDKYLRTLTQGDYKFVYRVTNGRVDVTRLRKITITA